MKNCLFILLLLVGCGDEFEKPYELGKLRVLAITANTPEINAASAVTLIPLISYVDGGNTTLNYTWEACPDPGIDFGADANCDDAAAALTLNGGSTFNTATLGASYFTGNATNIVVNIPAQAFVYLGTLDSNIQFNGLDYLVIVTYTDQTNGNSTKALKRIKLSTKAGGTLNTNPNFTAIQFNGSNLVTFPSSKGSMTISGPSAPQSYSLQTSSGLKSFSEDMVVSWYSSRGEFLFSRRSPGQSNEYDPSGNVGVFVAVYRDSRGGIATQLISF